MNGKMAYITDILISLISQPVEEGDDQPAVVKDPPSSCSWRVADFWQVHKQSGLGRLALILFHSASWLVIHVRQICGYFRNGQFPLVNPAQTCDLISLWFSSHCDRQHYDVKMAYLYTSRRTFRWAFSAWRLLRMETPKPIRYENSTVK